jgi:DNA-binding beta-propeller fold protein YncE
MKGPFRQPLSLARAATVAGLFGLLLAGAGDGTTTLLQTGRLIAYEPFETYTDGQVCVMPAEWQRQMNRAMLQEGGGGFRRTLPDNLPANSPYKEYTRRIRDAYPTFASVSVDTERNEVVFTDESTFKVLVYDRLENTPAGAEYSRPKRTIAGDKTQIEFQSTVYVDPKTGEIWAANNDTRDRFVVFGAGADGDVAPIRTAETPHGTFGLAVDEVNKEALFTIQHDSAIVTYRRSADGEDSPIRLLQGDKTHLQDPHGIALDPKDDVIFVSNFGSTHNVDGAIKPREGVPSAGSHEGKENWPHGREFAIPGSGTINPPSIIVHRRTASGNVAPLRVVKGPKTQLNWPTGVSFDPQARELFVANDAGMSVLVFDANASGDVAPKRIIRGPKTKLANPTGVFADIKNQELWVTNFGGHSATVYDLKASGDVAPKRVLRNAPEGTPSLMIGNPGTLGYDTRREQILVPN